MAITAVGSGEALFSESLGPMPVRDDIRPTDARAERPADARAERPAEQQPAAPGEPGAQVDVRA